MLARPPHLWQRLAKNDPGTGQPANKIEDKVFVISLSDPAAPPALASSPTFQRPSSFRGGRSRPWALPPVFS
jgi:hypothetical protein